MCRLSPLLAVALSLGCGAGCRTTRNGISAVKDDSGQPSGDGTGPVSGVLMHHNHPTRDGLYTEPTLTRTAAAGLHRDQAFNASFSGMAYAQPLFVDNGPGGKAVVVVATSSNQVYAFDATSGAQVWQKALGTPVPRSALPCGNIDPVGVTGTPVIDAATRTLVLDAYVKTNAGPHHEIYALSLDDGTTKSGFPVDVDGTTSGSVTFNSLVQNQRGALALLNGTAYVPYGGHWGDCPDAGGNYYHGWVIAVPLANPQGRTAWTTRMAGGGTWAPGGIATDGTSLFLTTGNTFNTDGSSSAWGDSEAILRLTPQPTFSTQDPDYFAPTDWQALDDQDKDVGGHGPILIHVDGATPSELAVTFGKIGAAYLVGRDNLGGISAGLSKLMVNSGEIIGAGAAVPTPTGTYVIVHNYSGKTIGCNAPPASNLLAVKVTAASPPQLAKGWCASVNGRGAPVITTTDGQSESVAWMVAATGPTTESGGPAEPVNKMVGLNAETGAKVFDGGTDADTFGSVRRFQTPIIAHGRIYVAGDGRLYAFSL